MSWKRLGIAATLGAMAVPAALAGRHDARRDLALMVNSATAFLSTLTAEQLTRSYLDLEDETRERVHFIPNEAFARNGVSIEEMTPAQREAAHALLRASLSQRGYMTATQIMEAEGILKTIEDPPSQFDRNNEWYHLWVFGTPTMDGTWGWRWEGHHLSLTFTVVNGNVTVNAPTFLAAFPAEVPEGPRRGMRPLGRQEDAGRALFGSLTPEQREIAVLSEEAPREIVGGVPRFAEPLSPMGILGSGLDPVQRDLLLDIVEAYAEVMTPEVAELRMEKVRGDGVESIGFAWRGGTARGELSYFRVQGPSFLIEYSNAMAQENHVHSAWRDFDGDFGRDLIGEHLAASH